MVIRLLTKVEHEDFFKWYSFYHDKFPEPLLCDTIVAVEEKDVLGAGIMVQPIMGGAFCMFSFITRNPFCDRKFSSNSVDFLIKNLGTIAKTFGYRNFVSMIGEEPAKNRFRKNGIRESKGSLTLFWGEC